MGVTVMSGFSPKGRIEYGERFLAGFASYWPGAVKLQVFVEELAEGSASVRPAYNLRSLWDCPGQREFLDRHAGNLAAQGRAKNLPIPWKPGAMANGYNFRFDAVKFSRQCFIPETAAAGLPDGEILVWLDADVVTHHPVPTGFLEGLIGDADGAFLGRGRKHSEIGYWAVRLSPGTRTFLAQLAGLFRNDTVFQLKEWHSAFAWDWCRIEATEQIGLVFRDLTPGGQGHVWHQSPLCRYTDHLKGNRKGKLASPERRR